MRLLKLIAYSLVGYVIYQTYQGFARGASGAHGARGGKGSGKGKWGSPALRYAPVSEAAGKRGKVVPVDDADGSHMNRVVGRGVVS